MRSELLSVVEGDGVREVADWLEATHACCLCCVGGRPRQLDDFGQLGLRSTSVSKPPLCSALTTVSPYQSPRRALRATMVDGDQTASGVLTAALVIAFSAPS